VNPDVGFFVEEGLLHSPHEPRLVPRLPIRGNFDQLDVSPEHLSNLPSLSYGERAASCGNSNHPESV
jgi:hypothetical protein